MAAVAASTTGEKATKAAKQLPWTEPMVILLLTKVQTIGAHILPNKGEKWSKVNVDFFKDDLMAEWKDVHYKANNHRKLLDKYNNVMSDVSNNMQTGNQSGKEGDLSELFKLVRDIQAECDDDLEKRDTVKQDADRLSSQMNSNTSEILSGSRASKKAKPNQG